MAKKTHPYSAEIKLKLLTWRWWFFSRTQNCKETKWNDQNERSPFNTKFPCKFITMHCWCCMNSHSTFYNRDKTSFIIPKWTFSDSAFVCCFHDKRFYSSYFYWCILEEMIRLIWMKFQSIVQNFEGLKSIWVWSTFLSIDHTWMNWRKKSVVVDGIVLKKEVEENKTKNRRKRIESVRVRERERPKQSLKVFSSPSDWIDFENRAHEQM